MRDEAQAYEVLRAIRRIVRRIADHSRALSREAGLTVPQLMCLKAIGEAGVPEPTLSDVCDKVQLTPPTVSRIVDRLERARLVVRERRSPDRRRVCLVLTPEGRARFETLPTPLQERFVERYHALPEGEQAALLAALERVIEMMEAGDVDAAPILTTEDLG